MSKYISAILFTIALIIELVITAKVSKKIGCTLVVCTVIAISICVIYAYLTEPGGVDAESGLTHLSHVACNVAFLCELEKHKHSSGHDKP